MSFDDPNQHDDRNPQDAFETASDEAKLWGYQILQRLEGAMLGEERRQSLPPEPDSVLWSIPLASQLISNWEHYGSAASSFKVPERSSVLEGTRGPEDRLLDAQGEIPDGNAERVHRSKALENLLDRLAQWLRQVVQLPVEDDESALAKLQAVQVAAELYVKIRNGAFPSSEGALLQVLFASGHSTAIRMGVDLLVQQPPDAWTSASLALSPLVQYDDWDPSIVFPRIFGTANPAILATALDIANFLYSKKRVDQHPAEVHYETLVILLGQIVQRLGQLEEDPAKFGSDAKAIQRILFDSVSLCVSLCHTMSNLGKENCVGKLNQALELKHRRIRTEAAFALAKLNEKHGMESLVELAADPAVRSRVIAYAEELGQLEQIDEQYRSVLAIAESQLAQW